MKLKVKYMPWFGHTIVIWLQNCELQELKLKLKKIAAALYTYPDLSGFMFRLAGFLSIHEIQIELDKLSVFLTDRAQKMI